jgi:hypothetical protein
MTTLSSMAGSSGSVPRIMTTILQPGRSCTWMARVWTKKGMRSDARALGLSNQFLPRYRANPVLGSMSTNQQYSTAGFSTAAATLAVGADFTSLPSHTGGFGFENPVQGNTNDWLTPSGLPPRLGPFDLDPCGCPGMPWRIATTTFFLPEHDGPHRAVARSCVV